MTNLINETITLAGKGLSSKCAHFLAFSVEMCAFSCIFSENTCIFIGKMHTFLSNLHKMHAFS